MDSDYYTVKDYGKITYDESLLNTLTFNNNNEWVFSINFKDKTFKVNENYTMDDAAKTFWECVMRYAPQDYKRED